MRGGVERGTFRLIGLAVIRERLVKPPRPIEQVAGGELQVHPVVGADGRPGDHRRQDAQRQRPLTVRGASLAKVEAKCVLHQLARMT